MALTSADEVLDVLAAFDWGQASTSYSAWFEFERLNRAGETFGVFDFLDPLTPFEDCTLRRVGNCVFSDCSWLAEQEEYSHGGSMEGDAELPKLEQFTLSSTLGDKIEFDVYAPQTFSSAAMSAAAQSGGDLPPGGSWWGTFEGSMAEASTSVWQLEARGGSLDGLSLSGFTLPSSPTVTPEGSAVTVKESRVEISITEGADYQLTWQPPPDADFFHVYSDVGHLDTVQCFFDSALGEGTLPAELTQGFGPIELGVANLQARAFGEHLPRGRQTLLVLSAAGLIDDASGKPVVLVPK